MKPSDKYLFPLAAVLLLGACSEDAVRSDETQGIVLEAVELYMADRHTNTASDTRAVSDFVVNKTDDPTSETSRLSGGLGWTLNVSVYDYNSVVYAPADGTWDYAGGQWVNTSGTQLYFANYISPRVVASLFPVTEMEAVNPSQLTAAALLQQDILVQKEDNYYITPAHIPTIELRHKHSMLDFILDSVNPDDIASVHVTAAGVTYYPYRVAARPNEYLLILPEGAANPVVNLVTTNGARYQSTVSIGGSVRNHCYCVRLTGLELLLSSVTVINWTNGTALSGEYTTPASYPTFRGAPDLTITLTYDNGLTQDITFNERGETTVKPLGRTIVAIDRFELAEPIILDKMYVDLTDFIQ